MIPETLRQPTRKRRHLHDHVVVIEIRSLADGEILEAEDVLTEQPNMLAAVDVGAATADSLLPSSHLCWSNAGQDHEGPDS